MTPAIDGLDPRVQRLARVILERLCANEQSLKAAASGRITWRETAKDHIEVKIQPDL